MVSSLKAFEIFTDRESQNRAIVDIRFGGLTGDKNAAVYVEDRVCCIEEDFFLSKELKKIDIRRYRIMCFKP